MTFWLWVLLMWFVGWATARHYPDHFANGVLTRWPARIIRLPRPANRRVMRLMQILFLILWMLVHFNSSTRYAIVTFVLPMIILDLDDVITSDHDDRWKRRWEKARNAVKWKMDLPEPVRERAR